MAAPGVGEKRAEIYTYEAPWLIYAMGWSVRLPSSLRARTASRTPSRTRTRTRSAPSVQFPALCRGGAKHAQKTSATDVPTGL